VALKAQIAGVTVARADAAANSGVFTTARRLVGQLLALLPEVTSNALTTHAALLGRVWPDIAAELGHEAADAAGDDLETRHEWTKALEGIVAKIAEKMPLVLAVDNVDRADPDSVTLLVALARRSAGRVVVVATALASTSMELPPPVRALRDQSSGIRLRGLTEDGVATLVQSVFGRVPHARRTATRLFGATQGNPQHCMRLMEHWVSNGVVGYRDGVWALPIELPEEALLRFDRVALGRLERRTSEARHLVGVLSVLDAPASTELVLALANVADRGAVIDALDELVAADILVCAGGEYEFRQEALRLAVLGDMSSTERTFLHAAIADVLLHSAADRYGTCHFAAGLHLIRAGDERRGADLVAKTARDVLAREGVVREFETAVPALEAALEVYRRTGRKSLARLGLLVPMALASYDVSYEFARKVGDDAITHLRLALGLGTFENPAHFESADALIQNFARCPILEEGEERELGGPDVTTLVTWLVQCAMPLCGAASAAIDHVAQGRYIAALQSFKLLGDNHPAAVAYAYCNLVRAMTEDRFVDAYRGWSEMLVRIERVGFPKAVVSRLVLGAEQSLGVLEAQRDDRSALARIEALEASSNLRAKAIAHQLRFLFHGFRGELELAERARERLEVLAIQRGSAAWQVEIWSTCTLSAVYSNTRDIAGNRRVVEQLERLKRTAPSLELYWERAVAAQRLLNGDSGGALEIYRRLMQCEPRARVGWSAVRGAAVRALNGLARHEEARALAEETIRLSEEDRDYVAMNLRLWIELCIAHAGLGEFDVAKSKLKELFVRHEKNENPMTLGSLHATGAEIAMFEGDAAAFDAHVKNMERWFRSTKNPALVAQCESLRRAFAKRKGHFAPVPATSAAVSPTNAVTLARSVLASCHGGDERKLRAMELIAERAGTQQAWLFTVSERHEPLSRRRWTGRSSLRRSSKRFLPCATSTRMNRKRPRTWRTANLDFRPHR
jgi:hypothetical protein